MAVVAHSCCARCVAENVLFAKDTRSKAIFLICAACGFTNQQCSELQHEDVELNVHINESPVTRWTLGSGEEVERAGLNAFVAEKNAPGFEYLLRIFRGFTPRGT